MRDSDDEVGRRRFAVRIPAIARKYSGRGRSRQAFKVKLFKCFLDSAVSEQVARMVAMKGATENAGELIKIA